jgi:uncharacterized Fe-S cluster-containing protein
VLPRHVALRWAQRLKRVFGIEIEACAGGDVSRWRRAGRSITDVARVVERGAAMPGREGV